MAQEVEINNLFLKNLLLLFGDNPSLRFAKSYFKTNKKLKNFTLEIKKTKLLSGNRFKTQFS